METYHHVLSPAVAGMLRNARLRRGLNQREAARIIGCDRSTLSLLEGGKRAPSGAMTTAIARAYRLTGDEAGALRAESVAGVGWSKKGAA
jgi:transcriptional regulator with XRE-family HTH domain